MKRSQSVALEGLCSCMTVEEKVAAITQFDIMEVMDVEAGMRGEFTLDPTKLRRLAKAGVGSFLNSPTAGGPLGKLRCPTAAQWRGAMKQLEDAYEGKVRLLWGSSVPHTLFSDIHCGIVAVNPVHPSAS